MSVCQYCGRQRSAWGKSLNATNWRRHVDACKAKANDNDQTQTGQSKAPTPQLPKRAANFNLITKYVKRACISGEDSSADLRVAGEDIAASSPSTCINPEPQLELVSQALGVGNDGGCGGGGSPKCPSEEISSDASFPSSNNPDPDTSDKPSVSSLLDDDGPNPHKHPGEPSFPTKRNVPGDSSMISTENYAASSVAPSDNDPSVLKGLLPFSPELLDHVLSLGPCQPNAEDLPSKTFPKDKIGRSFHPSWFVKKLADGSCGSRDWLSYSVSDDKIYCITCMFFGRVNTKSRTWTERGFNTWKNGTLGILQHETSAEHVDCCLKAKLRANTVPLVPCIQEGKKKEIAVNREIVRQLVNVVLYLGRHSLAFRGHREKLIEGLHGNFLDLVLLLSLYSPVMASYLAKLQAPGRSKSSFLTWLRQNQIIECISTIILSEIKSDLTSSPFFSVSIDSTFDVSRKEQTSFILRYFEEKKLTVRERLVAMRETPSTTEEALKVEFDKVMREIDLDCSKYLVGQAYDGAGNMRGTYNGLQKHIRDDFPQALYVWCWAHRLNLVVTDSVSAILDAMDLFGNLEKLFDFIGSSKGRSALYVKNQKQLYPKSPIRMLKRINSTRWMCHSTALEVVIETFDALVETLQDLWHNSSDRKAGAESGAILGYLLSERFVYCAIIFRKIFEVLRPVNDDLQSRDLDLAGAAQLMTDAIKKIDAMRSDEVFDTIRSEVKTFIESRTDKELGPFSELPKPRMRKTKLMPGELAADTRISCPFLRMKVDTFFQAIDTVSTQLKERFTRDSVSVLIDLSLLTRKRLLEVSSEINVFPRDAFSALATQYNQFIDEVTLRREYVSFARSFPTFDHLANLPTLIHTGNEFLVDLLDESGSHSEDSSDEETFLENPNKSSGPYSKSVKVGHNQGKTVISSEIPVGSHSQKIVSQSSESMLEVLQIFCKNGLKTVFPNLYLAFKIGITLPVTSASAERSFSKLKIVKNRLRSTMTGGRLENLMRISCEHDIDVNVDSVVDLFARKGGKTVQDALLM